MVIYLTVNLVTGKKYIGKDRNNSPSYLGGGVNLKKDIKMYGRTNFKKTILETVSSLDELKLREIYWLEYYDAANSPNFYNITNKSNGSIHGPTKTELYMSRGSSISQSRVGKHYPEASIAQQGLKKPKVSKALTGKKKTETHCINFIGVMVFIVSTHNCVSCRGVKHQGASMVTSEVSGVFANHNKTAKQEVMEMIKLK